MEIDTVEQKVVRNEIKDITLLLYVDQVTMLTTNSEVRNNSSTLTSDDLQSSSMNNSDNENKHSIQTRTVTTYHRN